MQHLGLWSAERRCLHLQFTLSLPADLPASLLIQVVNGVSADSSDTGGKSSSTRLPVQPSRFVEKEGSILLLHALFIQIGFIRNDTFVASLRVALFDSRFIVALMQMYAIYCELLPCPLAKCYLLHCKPGLCSKLNLQSTDLCFKPNLAAPGISPTTL